MTAFVQPWAVTRMVTTNLISAVTRAPRHALLRRTRTMPIMHASSSPPSKPTDGVEKQGPTMVRARHILVESEEMLDAVRAQLDAGKGSFAELAKLVSTCTSKVRGGDLGWFRRNVMVKEFENAAFSNPPGSVVKVKSDFGWHLVLVEDHGIASGSISMDEFATRFGPSGTDDRSLVQLIDCRETAELELASLPGFMNLPMGEYSNWADDLDNGNLNLEKEKETIVMCHHGLRSANFCSFLAQQGFSKVRNLDGGIDAYSKNVDSSIPTY